MEKMQWRDKIYIEEKNIKTEREEKNLKRNIQWTNNQIIQIGERSLGDGEKNLDRMNIKFAENLKNRNLRKI